MCWETFQAISPIKASLTSPLAGVSERGEEVGLRVGSWSSWPQGGREELVGVIKEGQTCSDVRGVRGRGSAPTQYLVIFQKQFRI